MYAANRRSEPANANHKNSKRLIQPKPDDTSGALCPSIFRLYGNFALVVGLAHLTVKTDEFQHNVSRVDVPRTGVRAPQPQEV